MNRPYAKLTITKKGERAARSGHPWVYGEEVTHVEGTYQTGDIVDVYSDKDRYLGTGFANDISKIRVRIVSRNANDRFDEAFWQRRVKYALDYRKTVMGDKDFACCRLIFGDADDMPGLTVDRYNDVLVAQTLCYGMDQVKPVIFKALVDELAAMGVTRPPIHVTADAVLSMHPVDKNIGLYILKKHGITGIRRRLGIAVRNWQDHEAYKDAIAAAADELQETQDVHVIFIPMQYPADVEAGRDIASRMKTKAVVLDGHYTTVEFMSLMGCMDAVIANRLHALIFSAIMQVPATAVSYDPKIDSFIDLIGDRVCGTTEDVQAADIVADVSQKLALGHLAPEIKARLNHLRRQSLRNAYLALRILEGRKGVRKRLQQHRRSL